MSEPASVAALVIAFTGISSTISSLISSAYDVERTYRASWNLFEERRLIWEGLGTIAEEDTSLTGKEEYGLQWCGTRLHTLGLGHLWPAVKSEGEGLTASSRCSLYVAKHCQHQSREGPIFWRMQSWITVSPMQDINTSN
jgi:hypothetical protein